MDIKVFNKLEMEILQSSILYEQNQHKNNNSNRVLMMKYDIFIVPTLSLYNFYNLRITIMYSQNFMTFSLDDKLSCIQYFREGQIFVATPNSIKVYDLTQSTIVSQCYHSIAKNPKYNKENQKARYQVERQRRSQKSNQQHETLSALEMHYFPQQRQQSLSNLKSQQSQNQNNCSQINQWNDDQQGKRKTLGYLLVHYKMAGLSTYKVQSSQNQINQTFSFTNNNSSIFISFLSFLPVNFGSVFLNLAFLTGIYHQANSKQNRELKDKYLKSQNCKSTQSLLNDLKSRYNLIDFILQEKCKTRQFIILRNDNELFQIVIITLNHDGLLQTNKSFQIDQQSAKLNSCTVTALKYLQYRYGIVHTNLDKSYKNSSFLIMAMEAGDLLLYELPKLQPKSLNSQHYLEPIKKINVKEFLQFQLKKEDLDFSVTSIQLIHQSMAFLLVRNCGILLINLKDFSILNHLCLTSAPKKNYFFTDTRLIASVRSHISIDFIVNENPQQDHTKIRQVQTVQKMVDQKIQIELILANKSTLKNLFIQLTIDKILELSQDESREQFKVVPKVQISKMKCNIIEQLNTNLIENFLIVKHNHLNTLGENSLIQTNFKVKSLDQEIQIFGNFQSDKIFYFTP